MEKVIVTELEYRKAEAIFAAAPDFHCIAAPGDEAGLAAAIRREGARVVIVGVNRYTGALYEALPPGGVIARFGVGHDGIDKGLAKAKGIYCTNTPGVLDDSVAECAAGMLLLAARHFASCVAEMKAGKWRNQVGVELAGKTLAVIGCGNIGTKVARIARNGFAMTVSGFDVAPPMHPECYDVFSADFAEAVKDADFVTLHIPDIPATRNFIDAPRLALLKPGAWLINTARGGVLDEDALFEAASTGRLGGAEMSRTEEHKEGRVPLHTLRADIEYGFSEAHTSFGAIGVKVWVYNGMKYGKEQKEDAGVLVRKRRERAPARS